MDSVGTFRAPPTPLPGYGATIGLYAPDTETLIAALKRGLPVTAFERLRAALGVDRSELARVVGISDRTLARRLKGDRFQADESERIYRVARLLERAREVLGDDADAARWLTSPKRYLNGGTPLAWADTEVGAQTVARLLGRLEHGVFS